MAYLVSSEEGTRCYLKAHHIFGRLLQSANTVISKPEVSKIHAIVQWINQRWHLTDYSSNGTWINGSKVAKNTATPIKLGDVICFAVKGQNELVVKDLSEPCDLLVPFENAHEETAISLKPYNLLPSEDEPEISLLYEDSTNRWFVEHMLGDEVEPEELNHNDVIQFNSEKWQLKVNVTFEETLNVTPVIKSLNELSFAFNVSADEEAVQLLLNTGDQSIDLNIRTHHYLTLVLARKRVEDIQNGIPTGEQGWMYSEQLSKDLGLEQCHLNIQIHRARKQFSEKIHNNHLAQLFERKVGRVRLGSQRITINKNG